MPSHDSDGDGPTRKYADFQASDGTVVIYDTENPAAWVQSDAAIDLSE